MTTSGGRQKGEPPVIAGYGPRRRPQTVGNGAKDPCARLGQTEIIGTAYPVPPPAPLCDGPLADHGGSARR